MEYDLYLGDYAYSSWSLRGWLLFEHFSISARYHMVDFNAAGVAEQLKEMHPARTVPTLRRADGAVISDSLAIAEELATRHPNAGIWPDAPRARAMARSLAAEMHSGFVALRSACPMALRSAYTWANPDNEVLADLARLETIWSYARSICTPEGPWLCGDYSAADAFFAPVAVRIAGYALPVGKPAQTYVQAHLADPVFRRWRAMALVHGSELPWYAQPHPQRDWPGPAARCAAPTARTDSENETCPYSCKPVTDFLELDGRIFGFCNPFCRDKTAADPEAWPAFMALLDTC